MPGSSPYPGFGERNLPPQPTFCVGGRPQGGTNGARLVPDCRDLPLRYLCRLAVTTNGCSIQLVRELLKGTRAQGARSTDIP